MRNVYAVFWKQARETFRNKAVLIQFLLFPLITLVMENAIKLEGMPEHFFVKLFAVMFVGMAPLTCMSSVISEEREKNTLRALLMSNVRPGQYLLGVGAYVWLMCMVGAGIFALCGGYRGAGLAAFLGVMAAGILLSALVGAVIGVCSKNQMAATSITVPVMMVFSFLPMLSLFNETIEKVARVTYSQQISILINGIGTETVTGESVAVIGVNFAIALVLFFWAYRKKGLE